MPAPVIQSNIRVPGSYNIVDSSGANNRLPAYRQPMCIIAPRIKAPSAWAGTTAITLGEKVKPTSGNDDGHYYICIAAGTTGSSEPTWPGAGGSVTDGSVTWRELCNAADIIDENTPTRVYAPSDGARFGGSGSIAHRMVRAALRQYRYTELTLIAIDDDGSAVHASCTVTFTGTATSSGSCEIRIGNEKVTYAWGVSVTNIGVAMGFDAAIAALHDMPATPSQNGAGVLTLLAKNGGVCGNELGKYNTTYTDYRVSAKITSGTGISVAVSGWSGGANDPDITNALTAATAGAYSLFAIPYKDATNIAALKAHLLSVSDEINCNGARAWCGSTATIAIAATLAAAYNDSRVHVAFIRKCLFTSFELAAAVAAAHASTGHPALPLNTVAIPDCDAPDITDRLEFSELNSQLWAGVTPLNADGSGTVRIERSITTYTTNGFGSDDDTFLDTTVIACLDYMRKAIKSGDEAAFSQSVLRENHVDGEPAFVVTPDDINAFHIAKCKSLEKYGVCQQVDVLEDRFTAVRDGSVAGRVNSDIPVEVVQGLHVLANYIRLTTTV